MDFEEEEVVYEGSPLALHFQECGIDINLEKPANDMHSERKGISSLIRRKAGCIFSALLSVVNPPTLKNNSGVLEIIDYLVKFNLVDVDDLAVIKSFSSDNAHQVSNKWVLMGKAVLEITLAALPSVILPLIPKMKTTGKVLSVLSIVLFVYRWYPVIRGSMDRRSVKKLLEATAEFDRKTKRALNTITDYNSINQGYLMTKESHQIWNLEAGEIKELSMRSRSVLPGLRVALQRSTTRVTVAISQATCKLRAERPLPAHLDAEPFYLPDVVENDLMWLKVEDGGEELAVPTIRNLKGTVDILRVKRSEFLRRLVLGSILDEKCSALSGSYIDSLYRVLMGALKELELGIIFHVNYVRNLTSDEGKQKKPNSIGCDLENCLKSCSLHLQEALFNSLKLTEDSLSSFISKPLQDRKEFHEAMSRMSHHLTSAKLCLRHAEILYEKLNSSTIEKISNKSPVCDEGLKLLDTVETSISPCELIPQDEIFEMYFAGDDLPPTNSTEQTELFEVDHQNSAILMSELKGVLQHRAALWKEREDEVKRRQGSCVDSEESKDQEILHKSEVESMRGGTSSSGLEGKISLPEVTSCLSTEQGRSVKSLKCSVSPEEEINIPSSPGKEALGGGDCSFILPKEKGLCNLSGGLGFRGGLNACHSTGSISEATKEQELSTVKHAKEYELEVTSGSERMGVISFSDNGINISEKKLTPVNNYSVTPEEKTVEGPLVSDRLEFDGGHFTCINSREKEISDLSMEPIDPTNRVKSGLGVQALASEAVAKARATKSPHLMEEEFTFVGDDDLGEESE